MNREAPEELPSDNLIVRVLATHHTTWLIYLKKSNSDTVHDIRNLNGGGKRKKIKPTAIK